MTTFFILWLIGWVGSSLFLLIFTDEEIDKSAFKAMIANLFVWPIIVLFIIGGTVHEWRKK